VVEMALPKSYSLSQNYPNPFNPSTNIKFELPQASRVVLRIYNTLGQEVLTLVNQQMTAGVHAIQWDALDDSGVRVSSGLYIYQLRAGSFTATKRMTLMK